MSDTYVSEIHKLLKLGGHNDSHFDGAPAGLPVAENDGGSHIPHMSHTSHGSAAVAGNIPGTSRISASKVNFKSLLIYPVIFFVAFAFFYAVLNFPSILAQLQGAFSKPQAQVVLGNDSAVYY